MIVGSKESCIIICFILHGYSDGMMGHAISVGACQYCDIQAQLSIHSHDCWLMKLISSDNTSIVSNFMLQNLEKSPLEEVAREPSELLDRNRYQRSSRDLVRW